MEALSTAYSVFFLLMVIPVETFLAVIIYNHINKQKKNWVELETFFLRNLRKSILIAILVGIPISSVIENFSKMAYGISYIPVLLIFTLSLAIVFLVLIREFKKNDSKENI